MDVDKDFTYLIALLILMTSATVPLLDLVLASHTWKLMSGLHVLASQLS